MTVRYRKRLPNDLWEVEQPPGLASVLAKKKVIYIGPDQDDAAVRRRIGQIADSEYLLAAFTFRRHGKAWTPLEGVRHIDLGALRARDYLRRLPQLMIAFGRLVSRRDLFGQANIVIARNLDNLILAAILRKIGFTRAKLVYEVLDVRPVLLSRGFKGRLFRRIERRLSRGVDLLTLSSPRYRTAYFEDILGVDIPSALIENRLYLDDYLRDHPDEAPRWRAADRTRQEFDPQGIQLGCVCGLQCKTSASILRDVARAFPEKVTVHIAGTSEFLRSAEGRTFFEGLANVRLWGPYKYPDSFATLYKLMDLSWDMDLKPIAEGDLGRHSDWLLPNRIYEAGSFGVPQIAERGTFAGDLVEDLGIGWALPADDRHELFSFFSELDTQSFMAVKRRCVALMNSRFHYQHDLRAALDRLEAT